MRDDVVQVTDSRATMTTAENQSEEGDIISQMSQGLKKQNQFELMEQLLSDPDFEKMLQDDDQLVSFLSLSLSSLADDLCLSLWTSVSLL
jgi:predicted enzyme involved in methoxymalonyl-ACP biosynthesis